MKDRLELNKWYFSLRSAWNYKFYKVENNQVYGYGVNNFASPSYNLINILWDTDNLYHIDDYLPVIDKSKIETFEAVIENQVFK